MRCLAVTFLSTCWLEVSQPYTHVSNPLVSKSMQPHTPATCFWGADWPSKGKEVPCTLLGLLPGYQHCWQRCMLVATCVLAIGATGCVIIVQTACGLPVCHSCHSCPHPFFFRLALSTTHLPLDLLFFLTACVSPLFKLAPNTPTVF